MPYIRVHAAKGVMPSKLFGFVLAVATPTLHSACMDRDFFDQLSIAARAAINNATHGGLLAENKGTVGYDPVTEADRAAEQAVRRIIAERFPEHGIWGEEYGWSGEGAQVHWSLDPIDGTRAFVCGLPSWAVLVGLLDTGRHVAGMIDLPALDERLVAVDGVTLRDGAAVRASECSSLSQARWSTTDPFLFDDSEAERVAMVRDQARIARYGLDAFAYARLATGDLDLVVESGLKPHDYDALVAVVRGAGGVIGDWDGGDDLESGRIVAAATRELYDEAVAALAKTVR